MKLKSYGVSGIALEWLKSYLTNRKIQVAFVGYTSTPFTPTSGVPQGSVLGPLLFNIFINDLGNLLRCKYLIFADDLKIYICFKTIEDSRLLQADLDTLTQWCSMNKLELNIDKCKFIPFSLKCAPQSSNGRLQHKWFEPGNGQGNQRPRYHIRLQTEIWLAYLHNPIKVK